MAADGSIIIDTRIDTKGFNKGSANLQSQFSKLGSATKKIGAAIASAFAVREIVRFGRECLELGSDLQEVQNVVDVTFTTMNEQVNQFAKNAKTTAGLSETMAKQYVGTFGAMAKSFKFTEGEAYEMSTALTQLSGDVASFYNLTQEQAYTKLKSVFTGETESLKDLGVVMTQAALDSFALEKGLGKTTSQMTEQEKVALRYQFVMEQLSGASGDFVRTSDSWANQTRLLTLQFDQLKATIGQGLINALTPVLQIVNQLIGRLQVLADQFLALTTELFGNAGGSSGSAIEDLADGYNAAAEGASNLADATEEAGKAAKKYLAPFDEITKLSGKESNTEAGGGIVGSIVPSGPVTVGGDVKDELTPKIEGVVQSVVEHIKGLAGKVKEAFAPSIQVWGEAFAEIIPTAKESAGRVGAAFSDLVEDNLKPMADYVVKDWAPSIVNTFNEAFGPVFADVMSVRLEGAAADFEYFCTVYSRYLKGLKGVMQGVEKAFKDMCASFSKNWGKYGGSLLAGLAEFKEGLRETFETLYQDIIKPVFEYISETFADLWQNHLEPLWDNIVEFALSVGENILALWNGCLKPIIDWIIAFLAPAVTGAIDLIVGWISYAVGLIADVVGGIITILDGVIQFVVGVFTLDWERAWGGIVKVFEGLWNGIVGIVKGVVNTIIWTINAMITAIYTAIAGVINGVGSIVESFGKLVGQDWGFSVPTNPPQIPYLAKGAVLPPNKPFMAVVGDQTHGTNIEAPLSTIEEAVANVLGDMLPAMVAGFERVIEEQQATRRAVESIEVGDTTIGEAANRHNAKIAVITGGV